jgi:hypothetical protein
MIIQTMCMDSVQTRLDLSWWLIHCGMKYLYLVDNWGTVRETICIWTFLCILYITNYVSLKLYSFPIYYLYCINTWSTRLKSSACSLRIATSLAHTLSTKTHILSLLYSSHPLSLLTLEQATLVISLFNLLLIPTLCRSLTAILSNPCFSRPY